VKWINLAQDRDHIWALVNAVMNPRVRGMYWHVEQVWTSQEGNYCLELLLQCGVCV
jgi:hypothetical protein